MVQYLILKIKSNNMLQHEHVKLLSMFSFPLMMKHNERYNTGLEDTKLIAEPNNERPL